ncbi:MAG: hypothetical protein RXP28_05200 [Nitrososphaeria archaeon]
MVVRLRKELDLFCRGKNAEIEESAVMDRSTIGDCAVIKSSIIGRHVEVRSTRERPTRIEGSVIADDAIIGEGSELVGTKVAPHRTVSTGSVLYNASII